MQRTLWLDIAKCIAITFVVLGHNAITSAYPKLFNIIFSFHIPLFFFISGYLFNPATDSGLFCRKRFNALIRPYVFTIFAVSLLYILAKSSPAPLWYVFWGIYGNGPNLPKLALHLWFLPNLFLTAMFVWLAIRRLKPLKDSVIFQLLFTCGLLVFGYFVIHLFWNIKIPSSLTDIFIKDGQQFIINGLVDNPEYSKAQLLMDNQFILKGLPWSLDIIFLSASFFMSGFIVRKNKLEKHFQKHIFAVIALVLFCLLHYLFNNTIDLNLRRYDHLLINTFLACTGIYFCIYVSYLAGKYENGFTKVMQYIGKYSLIIFIFHPIIERLFFTTSISVIRDNLFIAYAISFTAGICVPLILNYLFFERFTFFRYWYYAKSGA